MSFFYMVRSIPFLSVLPPSPVREVSNVREIRVTPPTPGTYSHSNVTISVENGAAYTIVVSRDKPFIVTDKATGIRVKFYRQMDYDADGLLTTAAINAVIAVPLGGEE